MDFDNALSDSMVKRVISFVVAVIIVSVVAIPVVNAITDENGSDGGDSDLITYTNSGDYYYKSTANDNTVHMVQYINEWEYLTETTGRYVVTLMVDDSVIYLFTDTWDDDNSTEPNDHPIIQIGLDSERVFVVDPAEFGDSAFVVTPGNSFTPEIKIVSTEDSDSGVDECSFTVQNGVITYINNNDETVTSEYTMDYFYSTDNSGEYVLADTPFKMDNNSKGYICEAFMIDDSVRDTKWDAIVYGGFMSNSLMSPTTEIELDSPYDTVSSETTIFSSTDNRLITVSKIESEITLTILNGDYGYTLTDNTVSLKAIVPTTVTIDPSAPVEVTVTNSGQTYKELDDGEYTFSVVRNIDEQIISVNGEEVAIVPYANNYSPVLCLAYSDTTCVWLLANGYMYVQTELGDIYSVTYTSLHIVNKMWNPQPSDTYYFDYVLSNEGEYVYCTDSAKCLNTDSLYVFEVYEDENTYTVGYRSYGTPSQILSNLFAGPPGWEITNKQIHSTDNGKYTTLNDVFVSMKEDSGDVHTNSHTSNGFFVPKTFTYTESPDSGSDSSSNMTNTIIKTIPIFLVLGLLVAFALPMVQGKFE